MKRLQDGGYNLIGYIFTHKLAHACDYILKGLVADTCMMLKMQLLYHTMHH